MLVYIFYICVAWIVYVYVGYPLVIYCLAKMINKRPIQEAYEPRVTILIPAFNEEKCIAETIDNKLQLNYPKEKIEIIVVSDESDDKTDEIVRRYAERGVKLLRQVPRQGKTSGLNMAIPNATGEIVVFSDANSLYDKNALHYMMENFADSTVGYVTGKMVYTNSEGVVVGDGCSSYMRYENFIRKYETYVNSVVGVDGGIDAVRKSLYIPMNADQLPDFVLPLNVVDQGYRVVYEDRALLKEESLSTAGSEFRMRVRVSLRALWSLYDKRNLLNPFKFPIFSWELMSHKLLRYTVFIPQLILLVVNVLLLGEGVEYMVYFTIQILFYLLSIAGIISERLNLSVPVFITLPYYIVILNAAAAMAFLKFMKGEKIVIWKPRIG